MATLSTCFLLILSLFQFIGTSIAQDSINYVPVGCYGDEQKSRPLPELIHNYRLDDQIDWDDLQGSVIEPCARKVREKNYVYFGIQFYGECWSGPQAHETYSEDGSSNECEHGVGKGGSNMVYRLTGDDNECVNYKIFDSQDRSALTENIVSNKCDDPYEGKFQGGWYRFEGKAGTKINALKINENRCQSGSMAYYTGEHPGPNEGILEGNTRICMTYDCSFNQPIKIRNCGEFYVYYLKPIEGCYFRYCGDGI